MKFTLTITDMTEDDVYDIISSVRPEQIAPTQVEVESDEDEDVPTPGSSAPQLDSTGLPWDERIHSGSKKLNANGTWKARKGVQPVEKEQVEAELRAAAKAASLPVGATPVMQSMTMVQNTDGAVSGPYPMQQPMPQAPAPQMQQPMPQAPAPQMQQPAPTGGVTVQQLMGKFQELLIARKIEPNFSHELVQYLNRMFGTQYVSIADFKDNQVVLDAAMKYTMMKA